MKKFWSLLFVSLFVFNASEVFAQSNLNSSLEPAININYAEVNKEVNKTESDLKKGKYSKDELSEYTRQLNTIRDTLSNAKKDYERELKVIQKRIDALGEQPKEGEKEPEVIAKKRKEFNTELDARRSKMAEADILLTRLDEVDMMILNLRSKELLGNILERQSPLIYPSTFFKSSKLFVNFIYDMIHSPLDWYGDLSVQEQEFVNSNLMPVLFIAFLSLWIGVYLRLFIMKNLGYKKDIEHPRYGKKVSAAVFVAIAYGVIPASIIGGFMLLMLSTEVMRIGFFSLVINSFLYFLLYIVLAKAVTRVIFAPYNEKWRLVNVTTDKAKRVTKGLYLGIWSIGILAFLEYVAGRSNYPLDLSSFISSLSDAAKTMTIILFVKRFLWEDIDNNDDDDEEESIHQETEADENASNTAFKVTIFISLFAVAVFGLSIFGYPFLSSFILNRFMLSFLLVGLLIIIRKAFGELLHRLLLLRFWVKTFKLRRRIISKLNFWLSLIVDPLFVIIGIFSILALWGVSTDVLRQMLMKLFMGFTVGGVKISIVAIVLGILIFFVGISLVKTLKRRLMSNVLSKMDIDDGIKHSLESGFGFFGFVLSALLSIAIMGGDLTNFALIAGALSFGIGLGLQNIVNNFVSGIILLFERPIKVGDWVIVNGQEGVVKQINIRATELQTWKRASIIIPNADLLSNTVTNLTHDDTWGRLDIVVGVAYGSNTRKVAEILIECAEAQKRVLKKPAPDVIFKNFGESSLDFELRCYTADVMNGLGISSEIRFEIDKRFREENIDIPFPQRTLHIGDAITRENLNTMLEQKTKK